MTGATRPATGWLARAGRPAAAFRRVGLPLACYYAVTIALPVANGAAQRDAAFVDHALVVLVVPPILIVLVYAVHASARMLASVMARRSILSTRWFSPGHR